MRERVLTAILLASVTLSALVSTAFWPMLLFGGVVIVLGGREVARLLKEESPRGSIVVGLLTFGLFFTAFQHHAARPILIGLPLVITLIGICATYTLVKSSKQKFPLPQLGSLWIVGPVIALLLLHRYRLGGGAFQLQNTALMALMPVWIGDITAIFIGRQFGKHLLAPTISPKKTVEGAVANLLACVGTSVLVGNWLGFDLAQSMACGLLSGTVGQVGDLFESLVKRHAGLKDSGSLLPGHGGILDRIDSLLFTTPFVVLILTRWR